MDGGRGREGSLKEGKEEPGTQGPGRMLVMIVKMRRTLQHL